MVHPADFANYLRTATPAGDRSVMARLALNTLFDPHRFPVDLSEVAALGAQNRTMARAFLAWCSVEADHYLSWSERRCQQFVDLLDLDAAGRTREVE